MLACLAPSYQEGTRRGEKRGDRGVQSIGNRSVGSMELQSIHSATVQAGLACGGAPAHLLVQKP